MTASPVFSRLGFQLGCVYTGIQVLAQNSVPLRHWYFKYPSTIQYPTLRTLHTVAAPALRAAVKTELFQPFSSQLTKVKLMLKFFWPLLIGNLRINLARTEQHILFKQHNFYPTRRHSTNYERVALPDTGDQFLTPNYKLGETKCLIK